MKTETIGKLKLYATIIIALFFVVLAFYVMIQIEELRERKVEEETKIITIRGILTGVQRRGDVLKVYINDDIVKLDFTYTQMEMLSSNLGEEVILRIRKNVYGKTLSGISLVNDHINSIYAINEVLSTKKPKEEYEPYPFEIAEKELGEELGLTHKTYNANNS